MAVASRHSYWQRHEAGGKLSGFRSLWMLFCKEVMFLRQRAAPSLRRLRRHLPRSEGGSGNSTIKQLCFHGSAKRQSQPKADDTRRLRRRHNPLPRRREETPEAAEGGGGNLLSCSGLLLLQMTGRNRHLQKKGLGGKETACPLRLKWMRWSRFAARRVDVSVRPATCLSGEAPGGFSLPPQQGD